MTHHTDADFVAILRTDGAATWPRIWGYAWSWRAATQRATADAILEELEVALGAPDATRQSVLRHVRVAARKVVEWGPD